MPEIVSIGEVLIDLVATEQPAGGSWKLVANAGGAPANVAVGVARLGVSAGFVGCVGNDGFGRFLIDTLQSNGVDCQCVAVHEKYPTTLATVTLDENGDRSFAFYRSNTADTEIPVTDKVKEYISGAQIVVFGAVSLAHPDGRESVLSLLGAVRDGLVAFDPNYRPSLWKSEEEAREIIGKVIKQADIVKVSEEELEFLTGGTTTRDAQKLMANHRLFLVSRGEKGCSVLTASGNAYELPAFRRKAVDTTGAGDAFLAGLLTAISLAPDCLTEEGEKLKDAVQFAQAAAAVSVERYGAIPSLPTRDEVELVLRSEN